MKRKPTNAEFREVFDRIASKYDLILNRYAVERRIAFVKKYAKGNCLEVGAGSGEISKALKLNNKHKVTATDISSKMIKTIENKLRIRAIVSDAENLPFEKNSFDTIIAAELIYYLNNPNIFLRKSFELLKIDGRLIITSGLKINMLYDNVRSLLRKLGVTTMYFDDPNRQFMSLKELKRMLLNNGFKIKYDEKVIILPWGIFDSFNRYLEKTVFKHFASFVFIYAEKSNS